MYLLIFAFWLILNGKITLEILLFGLGLTVLSAAALRFLIGYGLKSEIKTLKRAFWMIPFILILLGEVLKANFAVMRLIPGGEKKVHPSLVTFHTDLKSEFCRFLLANSITLTPGTITVEAEDDKYTVHCLEESLLDVSDNSRILKILRKMEA